MGTIRKTLMNDLRGAMKAKNAVAAKRILRALFDVHVLNPLDRCLDVANAKMLADTCDPTSLTWMCIPTQQREAALGAYLACSENAKDVQTMVMHLTGLAIALSKHPERAVEFLQIPTDTSNATVQRREVLARLQAIEATVRVPHSIGTAVTEVNATKEARYSLMQVTLMATIKASGPRSDVVNNLVHQMTEVHGEAATLQLAVQVMNPLIWTVELESHDNLHMA
ncbi:hypothetical protein [Burkholderia glumae]|uniref:hypothetical protein n=1 Tax=Burkholderia glumae TaxID=337 RepID=UPI002150500F|nr:hypothetical protein [Burkholderia glumae]